MMEAEAHTNRIRINPCPQSSQSLERKIYKQVITRYCATCCNKDMQKEYKGGYKCVSPWWMQGDRDGLSHRRRWCLVMRKWI